MLTLFTVLLFMTLSLSTSKGATATPTAWLGAWPWRSSSPSTTTADTTGSSTPEKQIVLLRHGCTYMNEFLGRGVEYGAPGFTDIFEDQRELVTKYLDTPLTAKGIQQAQQLGGLNRRDLPFLADCQLVVCSPLRRALQTMEYALRPHLSSSSSIPIVALPEAAERLYLISDVGTPLPQLRKEFPYVEFLSPSSTSSSTSGSAAGDDNCWWYQPGRDPTEGSYREWRPHGQGQRYACPGEPQQAFDQRMMRLVQWLEQRPENNLVLVCHWGVIEWMTGREFHNCQWQQMSMSSIRQYIEKVHTIARPALRELDEVAA